MSKAIIQISLETKTDIIYDLISPPLLVFLCLALLSVYFILKIYKKVEINQWKSPLIIIAILSIIGYFAVEKKRFGTLNRKFPYSLFFAAKDYLKTPEIKYKKINEKLKANQDSLSVVFVLGESVRAKNLSLNGYARLTNPLLSKRTNIISFSNAYTPLTYTAISVPQILSDAPLNGNSQQANYSLIDALNEAGIQTNWVGNQTAERSYELFINQSKFNKIIDPSHSDLSFQKDLDENLIPIFEANNKPNINQFSTIHMIGSHWWYETRYSEAYRQFTPVIKSKYIPSNAPEEMINSYDNTILYLDAFLDKLIEAIDQKNKNSILIYVADHGEILGEDNLWLHAQESEASQNPAMIIWYSQKFQEKYPQKVLNFEKMKHEKIGLDFFFPSVLDLFGIKGISYDQAKILQKNVLK